MNKAILSCIAVLAMMAVSPAQAGNLSYQGQNPAIFSGANPAGNAALLSSVNRPHDPRTSANTGQLTPAAIVQQGVLSQVSNRIYTQIFNNANLSGNFDLGGGNTISYLRGGGNLVITFNDPVHGQTIITIPDL